MNIRLNSGLLGLFLLCAGLAGCNLYRVDVQQGNILKESQVQQLKPGMTRDDVRNLMGTPLLNDPFQPNRWDYVYSFKPSYGSRQKKHVTVFFDNEGKVARIERDLKPPKT